MEVRINKRKIQHRFTRSLQPLQMLAAVAVDDSAGHAGLAPVTSLKWYM